MTRALASYRLQLHTLGGLRAARALVPYLRRLGVTHLYLAPVLRARSGSRHGYDGIDPTRVDPALGGEAELGRLARAARAAGLGLILDWVPNHLAADPENPFFDDLLRHGPASRFASWFDVDWEIERNRHAPLLLPVLGEARARVLARGELRLVHVDGVPRVAYHERSFPLDPASLPPLVADVLERLRRTRSAPGVARALASQLASLGALPPRARRDARSRTRRAVATRDLHATLARLARTRAGARALERSLADLADGDAGRRRLARLLAPQAYRLGYWRSAQRRLAYRRFFDVNELIGVRVEDSAVFAAIHAKVLELVERDWIDGLRIDHVDGLLDPRGYLARLQRALEDRLPRARRDGFLLLVEKILARDEHLAGAWPVDGTTGYEFLNQLEAALLAPEGVARIEGLWRRTTGLPRPFEAVARAGKRQALGGALAADVRRLAGLAEAAPGGARIPRRALERALGECIVQLPVYRAYPDARGRVRGADRERLAAALDAARREGRAPRRALDHVAALLLDDRRRSAQRVAFARRFPQLSGPAAAKGIEDTAFYVHVPLLSRNEVGGEPGAPLDGALAELHAENAHRARRWPRTLLAASTHDTKRSADLRARLDVLAEIPERWEAALTRWRRAHRGRLRRAGGRRLPDPNTEYALYQTLVGVWPLPGRARPGLPSGPELRRLRERVLACAEKSAREAKRETSWLAPDPVFEQALRGFVGDLFASRRFLRELAALVAEVARPGLWNALTRTLVTLAGPGSPDLYQGDELWRFSLVDPDNRRPVDFAGRARALAALDAALAGDARGRRAALRRLAARPEDGRLKLHVIRAALAARGRHPRPFAAGDYRPLRARGPHAEHVLAFARRAGRELAVVVAPRLPRTLVGDARRAPLGAAVWGGTRLRLPPGLAGRTLRCALSGAALVAPGGARAPELPVARLLETLPVALLLGRGA